jgi:parallel beta-helix repeat protein
VISRNAGRNNTRGITIIRSTGNGLANNAVA